MNNKKIKIQLNLRIVLTIAVIILLAALALAASLAVVYNSGSSSEVAFVNNTESSNLGARTTALVLNMEFNTPPESNGSTNLYVQDNSIYNNYGILK